jgi:predicted nucleic acid-binding protein
VKVVVDSGPLMALGKIGQIHLLYPVYDVALVPSAVYQETVRDGLARGEPDAVAIEMEFSRQHLQIVNLPESSFSPQIASERAKHA